MKRLTIAIDCDGTWSADPLMWRRFAADASLSGHTIIMVTGRPYWSNDLLRLGIPGSIPIIYAGGKLKEAAARERGHEVDIWIDDMPGTVQDCRILNIEGELP